MKVVWSRSTHAWVMTSVSCSISLMRAASALMFWPPETSLANCMAPSTVSAAWRSKSEKKSSSRGRKRRSIGRGL